jgi:hypothetical protein
LEEELEEELVSNLQILKSFGYDLELYIDPASKQSDRQFICKGNGGRIDLLCYDKKQTRYVVIELKTYEMARIHSGRYLTILGGCKIEFQMAFL